MILVLFPLEQGAAPGGPSLLFTMQSWCLYKDWLQLVA
jgi:hypothetical protein